MLNRWSLGLMLIVASVLLVSAVGERSETSYVSVEAYDRLSHQVGCAVPSVVNYQGYRYAHLYTGLTSIDGSAALVYVGSRQASTRAATGDLLVYYDGTSLLHDLTHSIRYGTPQPQLVRGIISPVNKSLLNDMVRVGKFLFVPFESKIVRVDLEDGTTTESVPLPIDVKTNLVAVGRRLYAATSGGGLLEIPLTLESFEEHTLPQTATGGSSIAPFDYDGRNILFVSPEMEVVALDVGENKKIWAVSVEELGREQPMNPDLHPGVYQLRWLRYGLAAVRDWQRVLILSSQADGIGVRVSSVSSDLYYIVTDITRIDEGLMVTEWIAPGAPPISASGNIFDLRRVHYMYSWSEIRDLLESE